ncbi:helix-turn-helix domain-containing protein [Altericroceibacterium endophyticum]|uniref:helix-turn-helix domain-containing protein n=1 Tax=Altericroceibacterium endophyticum TaxID=1808508 RepID=UPI0019295FFA|nr:helix-turn-helix domain-containing protein [Altericroceibacterium endophyticum]
MLATAEGSIGSTKWQRILVAAEELFLERGANVPLDEVAKRAKVGAGTLYRRFPTREALLWRRPATNASPRSQRRAARAMRIMNPRTRCVVFSKNSH